MRFFVIHLLPGLLIAAIFSFWLYKNNIKVTKACEAAQNMAISNEQQENQKKIKILEEQYNERARQFIQKEDSGYGVGPLTTSVLERLQNKNNPR
jgi:hypothetical protein